MSTKRTQEGDFVTIWHSTENSLIHASDMPKDVLRHAHESFDLEDGRNVFYKLQTAYMAINKKEDGFHKETKEATMYATYDGNFFIWDGLNFVHDEMDGDEDDELSPIGRLIEDFEFDNWSDLLARAKNNTVSPEKIVEEITQLTELRHSEKSLDKMDKIRDLLDIPKADGLNIQEHSLTLSWACDWLTERLREALEETDVGHDGVAFSVITFPILGEPVRGFDRLRIHRLDHHVFAVVYQNRGTPMLTNYTPYKFMDKYEILVQYRDYLKDFHFPDR